MQNRQNEKGLIESEIQKNILGVTQTFVTRERIHL
jgi:hypothetical protein